MTTFKILIFIISLSFGFILSLNSKPLLIDVFMFNGEPAALLRMNYLKEAVDYFIITEAYETHSGNPKTTLFVDKYANDLAPFLKSGQLLIERIHYPNYVKPHNGSWDRERYQRNHARLVVQKYIGSKPYFAIFSDADEIPRKELLENLKFNYSSTTRQHFRLEIITFMYSYKWRVTTERWLKSYILNDICLNHHRTSGIFDLRFK